MQQNEPFVSIIIPTYNRLNYFKISVRSVLSQSYQNFEVIVTDDSTNDDIEKYIVSLRCKRIRYFKNASRLGIAGNIKSGLKKACGQYFCFLNDDDFWLPDFLQKMVRPIRKDPSIKLVFCDHWLVDSSGKILTQETYQTSSVYGRAEHSGGYIPAHLHVRLFVDFTVPVAMACLMKTSVLNIQNYPDKIGPAYDRWLLMQYVTNDAQNIYYIDDRLTCYRIHEGSTTTRSRLNVMIAVIFILKHSLSTLRYNRHESRQITMELSQNYKTLVKLSLLKAQPDKFIRSLIGYIQSNILLLSRTYI